MYLNLSAALLESHQIACHKHFSVVHFEEQVILRLFELVYFMNLMHIYASPCLQEYQPYFVSPMEIILSRNEDNKRISFCTTLDNVQRHTETLLPISGVQLVIQGQGSVPPTTSRGQIKITVRFDFDILLIACICDACDSMGF
jgi:hypothetical protein